MSTIISSACWSLEGMSSTQKLVLISLADQANDDGVCWPGMQRLMQRTCLTERAIRGAIRWLEASGLLVTTVRSGTSNSYKITPKDYREQAHTPAPDAAPALNAAPAFDSHTPAPDAAHPGTRCRSPRHVVPPNRKEPSVNRKEPEAGCAVAPAAESTTPEKPEQYLERITRAEPEHRQKFPMTLGWQPSQMFSARAKPQGVNPDKLTPEVLAAFVSHYEADGKQENQGQWENILVRWLKRERPSNVTPIRPGSMDEIMQDPNALTQPIFVKDPSWDEVTKNCVAPEVFKKNITALRAMLEA